MLNFFKRAKKDPKRELKELLGDYELPRFPSVVMDVLAMLRDPGTETSDIANKIEMDMSMSIKVLRLINSAAFGLSTKVSNLQHAVTILGRSRLESMLLTYAVANAIPPSLDCMDISIYWLASARRACLAKHMAMRIHASTKADSFTAALLQDLAIPLISGRQGQAYTDLIQEWHATPDADICALEREKFGYDHATVGALIAEEWGLSEYLINAIAGHHDLTEESSAEPAVRLVSQLRYLDEEEPAAKLIQTAIDEHGFEPLTMEEIVETAFDEANQFATTFH